MSGSVQKNFRLPVELAGRLAVRAREVGVGQTAVVVGALEAALGVPASAAIGSPQAAASVDRAAGSERLQSAGPASPRAPGLRERTEPTELERQGVENVAEASHADAARRVAGPVDFAVWLSGVTGMPRSLLRRDISRGRVSVDGVVVTALELSVVPARESVRFDGRPV